MRVCSKGEESPLIISQEDTKSISTRDFYYYIEKLCKEYDKLNYIIKQFDEGMIIVDPHQKSYPITFCNPGFTRLTQYTEEEVLGQNCRILQGNKTDRDTVAEIRMAIKEKRPITKEILNYRKDGTIFWNELKIRPIFDHLGKLLYFIGIQTDVTIRRNAQEMAYYDSLTSSPNRRFFEETLREKLEQDERVTLLLFDIDRFKQINDTYGHIEGDKLLIEISKRLKNLFHEYFFARLGGDEFIILLPEAKDEAELMDWIQWAFSVFSKHLSLMIQKKWLN
ncbi:sensor histidine kinase [Halalkalibacter wakoensis JCM 9140]|uniref:Sensor histidine kinase n=1 Tax=Halalkalibacter wakoensis JCM 9140 TaxID=1236970 RepID=W4Q1M9_9BACI|nr:GGDEF domain-containing protein [Halalkalibacter wakoensis]GAE25956.1 sensor histidine kinase [Halalkalibacter wakoensis JCM 9140]